MIYGEASYNVGRRIQEMFIDTPEAINLPAYLLLNGVATEEQLLELIALSDEVFPYITAPTDEMKRLHAMKWKL